MHIFMKRIINILFIVVASISLVSCINKLDEDEIEYYVSLHHRMVILNKSSQSVRIYNNIIQPDSTYIIRDVKMRRAGVNPRDSIKEDKYAFISLPDTHNFYVFGFNPKTQSYDSLLQSWANLGWSDVGYKTYSIFSKRNWELTINKDILDFDYGIPFPEETTRFQVRYAGYYGEFECTYTYTLTDEALNEK